jgi:methylglyoxal synthase
MLSGEQGGEQQIASRIAYNEIDVLLYFRDTRTKEEFTEHDKVERELLLNCDRNRIPYATNIATAELIIMALDRGDLSWREIVKPKTQYTN